MMCHVFKPGAAYKFTACIRGGRDDAFVAVAAERLPGDGTVSFVVPRDLIQAEPWVLEDREFVKVDVDGREYCASAAAPLDLTAAKMVLAQVRR